MVSPGPGYAVLHRLCVLLFSLSLDGGWNGHRSAVFRRGTSPPVLVGQLSGGYYHMTNFRRVMATIAFCVAMLMLLLTIGAPRASADSVFDLTSGNSALTGFAGPYAVVDVHLDSSTVATITFTSLTNAGDIYLLGDGGKVGVNVNATSFVLGFITGSNAGTGF